MGNENYEKEKEKLENQIWRTSPLLGGTSCRAGRQMDAARIAYRESAKQKNAKTQEEKEKYKLRLEILSRLGDTFGRFLERLPTETEVNRCDLLKDDVKSLNYSLGRIPRNPDVCEREEEKNIENQREKLERRQGMLENNIENYSWM